MKRSLVLLALLSVAAAASADNCPKDMEAIDLKLTGSPRLASADMSRVMALRTDGEKLHQQGRHGEARKALAEAKKLLGM